MTQENINYKNNLRSFTDTIKHAFVTRVNFHVDLNPTFDKKIIPFDFKYCHAVTLMTDGEIFLISTSMTTSGADTFWITPTKTIKDSSSFLQVDSRVKNIDIKNSDDNYPFKINIEFEKYITTANNV